MEHLLISATRAVRSLFAPGMLGIFIWSVLLTVAVLIGFVIVMSGFFTWLAGQIHSDALAWVGTIGSMALAWMLFPGIMPIIVNFFDDRISRAIEQQDYPASPPLQQPDFWPELWHDVRFSAFAIFINILVLPLYLLPVLNLFLFYLLNGYLLGREFFVMAARRHLPLGEAAALRRRHSKIVLAAGIALALVATLPILNLIAPFWGIALMVHLYHRLAGTPSSAVLPPNH